MTTSTPVSARPALSLCFDARGDALLARGFTLALRYDAPPGRFLLQAAIATGTVRGAHLAIGKGDRPHVAWMGSSVAEPKAPSDSTPAR